MHNFFDSTYSHAYSSSFRERVNLLLTPIKEKNRIISIIFFGKSTEDIYPAELNEIRKAVDIAFSGKSPLISYIIQPLSNLDEMAVEINYIIKSATPESVDFKTFEDVRYLLYKQNNTTFLVTEGILGKSFYDSVNTQATDIFDKILSILSNENLDIGDIIRQWNYIGHITETEDGIQNYQAFNDVRSRFYERVKWNHGFPAATGIGMACRGVVVSLISMANTMESQIVSLDNPLQIPAFAYSESLLIGKQSEITVKATPKFERANLVTCMGGVVCFISGTAAIRGEMSMIEMNAGLQTNQIIENILYLISKRNLSRHGVEVKNDMTVSSLRVYIKNKVDFDSVMEEVEKVWTNLPVIYVEAGICRKELLVEIEGVAYVNK